ncbi:prolipoprotein diacylglyceryl transferase family protein [Phenylobacterium sp.]|uniref:prolipoprotein diacylglyceryl transferase family protein n=1 Tax=Phenylobacterium sp. TaxID=1871053 RepID=UPI0025E47D52|nr:prolipoprotein diacylglyceryl transferase family protein [Phenylobacterium sp.]
MALLLAGAALWASAVAVFMARTGKLPLNADAPQHAVVTGPYQLLDDPIYVGFVLAVLGAAVCAGSAPGVWIVTPVTAAATAALVMGYESRSRPQRPRRARLSWPDPSRPRLRVAATGVVATVPLAVLAAFGCAASWLHGLAVRSATRIANSWTAVRLGPLRIINYAIYAALAAAGGTLVFELAAPGPSAAMAALIVAATVLGGGVWGKLLESTGRLARPFGYFGAFLGGVFGVFAASRIWGVPVLMLGACVALAATWTQAVGRLRCLVQGCCHGRLVPCGNGICYRRAESRAVALAGLRDQPLYPTPVFSIYANLFAAVLLVRLYLAQQDASALLAAYLAIAGLSRFAEEGFRGEATVRRWRGLSMYQWLALGQLAAAAVVGLMASPPLPALAPLAPMEWLVVLLAALGAGFAMGADFPDLDAPLARLTPASAEDR